MSRPKPTSSFTSSLSEFQMDAALPLRHSISYETGLPGTRWPRTSDGRDDICPGASTLALAATRDSTGLPAAFQGMLKTTTETGDIGIFSIKPSRVQHPVHRRNRGGQQQRQIGPSYSTSLHDYGLPTDDRQRLPSYGRDATSEVISLCETASQKSASRIFEEPDVQSHSMTQSSYPSYMLKKHRSYVSLKSQADGNRLPLQRPRSPFAYPARLRRPGFRPSSPALTDGGIIDYSRRAEIERTPQGIEFRRGNLSPLSLSKQGCNRPSMLHPGGHRSNPSLLSQSPHRASASPTPLRNSQKQGSEWHNRNAISPSRTSPSRSTFSLASITNLHDVAPPPSTTSTPGKIHPPSPLYYDYTEDFEDAPAQAFQANSPPEFEIEDTIHEDHIPSGEIESSLQAQRRPSNGVHKSSISTGSVQLQIQRSMIFQAASKASKATHPNLVSRNASAASTEGESCDGCTLPSRNSSTVSLSDLDLNAQELNSHVEEAFGLPPSTLFELPPVGDQAESEPELDNKVRCSNSNQNSRGIQIHGQLSPDSASYRQDFSLAEEKRTGSVLQSDFHCPVPDRSLNEADLSEQRDNSRPGVQNTPQESSILKRRGRRFLDSCISCADLGERPDENQNVKVITTVVSRGEDTVTACNFQNASTNSTTSQDGLWACRASLEDVTCPLLATSSQMHLQGVAAPATEHITKRVYKYYGSGRPDFGTVPSSPNYWVGEFCHQESGLSVSCFKSPILAPMPISPARELKLKNSIPQLMKALPPLPLELPVCLPVPLTQPVTRSGHPESQLPSVLTERENNHSNQKLRATKSTHAANHPQLAPPSEVPIPSQESLLVQKSSEEARMVQRQQTSDRSRQPPKKLKLKMKKSNAPSVKPSLISLTANTFQKLHRSLNAEPPEAVDEESDNSQLPRFKLKINQASSSTLGTVRVHRDAIDSKHLSISPFEHPKDLFTPDDGVDSSIWQVRGHVQPLEPLISNSRRSTISKQGRQTLPNFIGQTAARVEKSCSEGHSSSQATPIPMNPIQARGTSDVKSFFSDDSSYIQVESHSLRKRLSNFRARIAVPYTSRNGTHSYDDMFTQDEDAARASTTFLDCRSTPLLDRRATRSEVRSMKRLKERIYTSRMQERLSAWLKEARIAIVVRVRPKSSTGRSDNV